MKKYSKEAGGTACSEIKLIGLVSNQIELLRKQT